MTKVVWKYALAAGKNTLYIPEDCKFLHVDVQDGKPHIWVLVDHTKRYSEICVFLAATGEHLPENVGHHVGTFLVNEFVFHVFEVPL